MSATNEVDKPAVTDKPTNPLVARRDEIQTLLTKYSADISKALPRFIPAERLIRVAVTAMTRTPELLQCTTPSIIGSIMQSAQLGLMPDGVLGEAYLIPFENKKKRRLECQFLVGYRGYIALAYRSGQVASLQARAVYADDVFEYEFGLNERLKHVPSDKQNSRQPEQLSHAYVVIKMKSGGHVLEVMNRAELLAIRECSKSKNSQYSPWSTFFAEMCVKSVIRRIAKRTPLSTDWVHAAVMDERADVLGDSQLNEAVAADFIPGYDQEAIERAEQGSEMESSKASGALSETREMMGRKQ